MGFVHQDLHAFKFVNSILILRLIKPQKVRETSTTTTLNTNPEAIMVRNTLITPDAQELLKGTSSKADRGRNEGFRHNILFNRG